MRRLVLALLVVLALFVVADRLTVHFVEQAVAEQARQSADLTATPTVKLRGFPFLTQAISGRFERIDLRATDLDRGGVRVASLSATLHDAQVPWREALDGSVTSIPVGSLEATAVVAYADLAHRSRLVGVTIVPEGDRVRLTGRVSVLGQSVQVSALSAVSLKRGRIAVTATSVRLLGMSSPALVNAVARVVNLTVPVGTLPYDLQLTGLRVTPEGLLLEARSGPTVLSAA